MSGESRLILEESDRIVLWRRLVDAIETYAAEVDSIPVSPELVPERIRKLLDPHDFENPLSPLQAVDFIVESLSKYQVHTPHPMYFGLFNPAPTTMGIAADALVAAFNPQLASWSHSPLAVDKKHPEGESEPYLHAIAMKVVSSGKAWISTTRVGNTKTVLRACITNYRTEERHIDTLLDLLNQARRM